MRKKKIVIPKIKQDQIINYHLTPEAKERGATFNEPRFGDSGYDIRASDDVVILPNNQILIPTGLTVEIPYGYVGLMKERSSLAMRRLNVHAGVIDPSFRGELKVVMSNNGDQPYSIEAGQKIAQLLFLPAARLPVREVELEDMKPSLRGDGSFGSTGK